MPWIEDLAGTMRLTGLDVQTPRRPGGRSLHAPDAAGVWRWRRDLRWDEL